MRQNVMPNEINPDDPRSLWQSQEGDHVTITLDEIRHRATRFERRVWWRNFREYAAGALVIGFFTAQLWFLQGWRLVPPILLIAAAVYVMIQLHRRGSARSIPPDADARTSLELHRMELERQRDALRTVWHWYLLPPVPGLVAATVVVSAAGHGINAGMIGFVVLIVLVFVGVWALNQWAARKLERKIQELKALEGSNE
jgi:Flp pilus assembly protein TadB